MGLETSLVISIGFLNGLYSCVLINEWRCLWIRGQDDDDTARKQIQKRYKYLSFAFAQKEKA